MANEREDFLPDGEWEGFYLYAFADVKHKMKCFFTFSEGKIDGSGSDDVGGFSWSGNYDGGLRVAMTKSYRTHPVFYAGDADENGIWGTWTAGGLTGGFHLWPKKQGTTVEETEKAKIGTAVQTPHA